MISHDEQARKIKHEQPSTPATTMEDGETEQRSSGRHRRGTRGTIDDAASTTNTIPTTTKRKRGPRDSPDVEDSPLPTPAIRPNPNQVLTTRNFPRTCATIMNDVSAHKHAGIFAKPLTERDAPGYKDLIYRPQDLRSIKSAIHHGNKAVNEATTVSTPSGIGDAGSPGTSTPTKSTNASVLLLPKTAELVPPKGIVNSAQLEKELVRLFANAIMFNPIPERGFGPTFRMTNDKGTVPEPEVTFGGGDDEGGVVNDTREMFEHVEKSVSSWRAAEKGLEDFALKGATVSMRGGSVSGGEVFGEGGPAPDEGGSVAGDGGEGGSSVTGTVRKRRKMAAES